MGRLWSPGALTFPIALLVCLAAVTWGADRPILASVVGAAILTGLALYSRLRVIDSFERMLETLRHVARGQLGVSALEPTLQSESWEAVSEVANTIDRQRDVLKSQQALVRKILDGFGEGLLAIGRDKRIVLSNQRLHEIFGTDSSIEGRLFYEIVRDTDVMDGFDRALKGERVIGRATARIGSDVRDFELRVVPLEDDGSIAAIGLFIDVTEIERLDRIRSEFVSDFSHEVRSPLAAMQSAVENLESDYGSEEQRVQLLRILSRQMQRLERLTSDLVDLNRIESGETELSIERVEIGTLIDDVVADFADRAAAAGVWLVARGESISAKVDPVRIEQVASILIDNALRHAPESPEISIETRRDEQFFEIVVKDQGPGIAASDRERIFNRFYQADRSRSGPERGAGLGLAIAKHLVLRHRGTLRVESPGEGASFIVRLPID